jgi:hypothetical protein
MGLEDAEGATETAPFCQGFRSLRLRCWICRAWGGGCEAVKAGLRRTRLPISLWPLGFFYYWRRRAADGMDGRYSFAGARGGILLPVPSTLSRLASPAIQWDLIFLNTFFLLFHLLFFIVVIDFLFIFDLLSNLKYLTTIIKNEDTLLLVPVAHTSAMVSTTDEPRPLLVPCTGSTSLSCLASRGRCNGDCSTRPLA